MKRIKLFIVVLLTLVGCQPNQNFFNTISNEQSQNYRSYYNLTLSAVAYQSMSQYFDISTKMTEIAGKYRYDIFIENPKVEMKNLLVMVVEDNTIYEIQTEMMPCIGIFDDVVNLVPHQSNPEPGYYKGINLNRVIESSAVNLKIFVQFESGENNQIIKEFFNFNLKA